jgi:hypothetical protein
MNALPIASHAPIPSACNPSPGCACLPLCHGSATLLHLRHSILPCPLFPLAPPHHGLRALVIVDATKKVVAVLKGTFKVEGIVMLTQEDDGGFCFMLPHLTYNNFSSHLPKGKRKDLSELLHFPRHHSNLLAFCDELVSIC